MESRKDWKERNRKRRATMENLGTTPEATEAFHHKPYQALCTKERLRK